MDREKIKEIAANAMASRKAMMTREKGYFYYHNQRVAKLALKILKQIKTADKDKQDIVYAGACLHDVCKDIEPHWQTGAHLVKFLLKGVCLKDEIKDISLIIKMHSQRQQKDLPDFVKVVQDADKIEHFGTSEVWLQFLYRAYNEQTADDALSYWKKEYPALVKKAGNTLNFDISREIFDDRVKFFWTFVDRFEKELNGEC